MGICVDPLLLSTIICAYLCNLYCLKKLMLKPAQSSLNCLAGFSFRMNVVILDDSVWSSYSHSLSSTSRHISWMYKHTLVQWYQEGLWLPSPWHCPLLNPGFLCLWLIPVHLWCGGLLSAAFRDGVAVCSFSSGPSFPVPNALEIRNSCNSLSFAVRNQTKEEQGPFLQHSGEFKPPYINPFFFSGDNY